MTTNGNFDQSGLEVLGPDECLCLLRSVTVGRLVYTQGGLPVIRLVNFAVDGDSVVFLSSSGAKLRAAERGDVVAFEADSVDLDRHVGWTVTVVGHLSVVPADEQVTQLRTLPLQSWTQLRSAQLVRLGVESVTGRRLRPWAQRPRTAG